MAKPKLKTEQIYQQIYALVRGNVGEFEFARIKREIEKVNAHDPVAGTDLMATLYSYKEDYPSAIKLHKKALALAPNLPLLHNNYGVTLREAGQLVEAQTQFLTSLSIHDTLEATGKALMISLELYDMKTFYLLVNQRPNVLNEIIMPETMQLKFNQLEALMQKANISKEALSQFSDRMMTFFKRHNINPINAQLLEDPEGGLYVNYEIHATVDEALAIDDDYIDFLMENNASNDNLSACFHIA